jgi:predicted O-linked N-acetylglucosamine transferase (SPINDLY family)
VERHCQFVVFGWLCCQKKRKTWGSLGQSFQSRVSSSLLHNLEMDDLITHNLKDYKDLAVLLGNNPSKLKEIKNKLLNNAKKTNVFNTKIYTSNLEKAYKQIYEAHKDNLKPDHIYLN